MNKNTKKEELTFEISEETKKFMQSLSDEEKEELNKVLQSLKRNPYQGQSIQPGIKGMWFTFLLKLRWLKREIELFFS